MGGSDRDKHDSLPRPYRPTDLSGSLLLATWLKADRDVGTCYNSCLTSLWMLKKQDFRQIFSFEPRLFKRQVTLYSKNLFTRKHWDIRQTETLGGETLCWHYCSKMYKLLQNSEGTRQEINFCFFFPLCLYHLIFTAEHAMECVISYKLVFPLVHPE